ncbi:MAG: phospholipase D-like domain-containing protein [Candidatus Thorarchaeota archaeon]
MSGVSVIKSPWSGYLEEIAQSSSRLDFSSPFIKREAVDTLIDAQLTMSGVTSFKFARFLSGASDIDALESLLDNGATMYSLGPLHAKVYVFDECAIVTSANLTKPGLSDNIEYGIEVTEPSLVETIRSDLQSLFKRASVIDRSWLELTRSLLKRISPREKLYYERAANDVITGRNMILDSLTGWLKAVYSLILQLDKMEFTLDEMYRFESVLAKMYPDNRHIAAKIRQTLQYLRDMGLIEFVGRGQYRLCC